MNLLWKCYAHDLLEIGPGVPFQFGDNGITDHRAWHSAFLIAEFILKVVD
jgi:hypothetical protein